VSTVRLGIDSYSYHRYFGELREGEEDPGIRWSHEDFMRRAGELRLDGVSLETCYLPMDDQALPERLAAQAAEHGLDLVLAWGHPGGLHMGASAAAGRRMLDAMPIAAAAGCRLVRIVVGTFTHWGLEPEAPILDRVVPLVAEGCEQAADLGMELAIETHCDLTLDALCELLDRVGRDDLGVVLDTANLVRIGEDLVSGTRRLAPFVRMLHVKDLLLADADFGNPGGWWPCCALGDGDLDLDGALAELSAAGFGGLACVEIGTLPGGANEDDVVARSVEWLRNLAPEGAAAG
jgi:sugar phosphate isomerase/epimerase